MKLAIIQIPQTLAGENHNIQRAESVLVMTEGLAGDAFDPVTINRMADMFFGNDQSQTRVGQGVLPSQQQNEGRRGLAGGAIKDSFVIARCQ